MEKGWELQTVSQLNVLIRFQLNLATVIMIILLVQKAQVVGAKMEMIRLIRFELQKVFSSRLLILIVFIILAANIGVCALHTANGQNKKTGSDELPGYSTDGGKGVNERYHKKLSLLILQTEMNNRSIASFGDGQDSYLYRSGSRTIEKYTALNEQVVLTDQKVTGWNEYFTYSAEFFFAASAVTLIVVFTAVSERKNGMEQIVRSCKNGRRKTGCAKFAAVTTVSLCLGIILSLSSFLTILLFTGYSDCTTAIQSVKALELSPIRTSIIGMFFLSLVYKVMSMILFSAVLFGAVRIVQSYVIGVLFGFFGVGISFALSGLENARFEQWNNLNVWFFFDPVGALEHYRCVNVMGVPVDLSFAGLCVFIVVFALAFILVLFTEKGVKLRKYRKSRKTIFRTVFPNVFRRTVKRSPHGYSLFGFEFCKQRLFILLFLLLIVIKVIWSVSYYRPVNNQYDVYRREYLNEISGPYTPEKRAFLEEESNRLAEYNTRESTMKEAYRKGSIDYAEYGKFLHDQVAASYRLDVIAELLKDTEYLEREYARSGVVGSYVYDPGYLKLFNAPVDYILLVFLLVFCGSFYLLETETRGSLYPAYFLIQTTKNGRIKLFRCKLAANQVAAAAAFGVFKGIDLIVLNFRYPLPEQNALLLSLRQYQDAPLGITIGSYLALTVLGSFFGTQILSLIIMLVPIQIKKSLPAFLCSASLLFVPHFIRLSGQPAGDYLDLTRCEKVDALFCLYVSHMYVPLCIFCALTVVMTVFLLTNSYWKIKKGIVL